MLRESCCLSLKSLSETRWACRYEAMRAVVEQLEGIIKMLVLLVLEKYSDVKTNSDADICLGQFVPLILFLVYVF